MTEAELLRAVGRLCDERHLTWEHNPDSRQMVGHRGKPDLIIVGRELIMAELKNNSNTLSPDQRRWGSKLQKASVRWYCWRPRDLISGVIQRELDSIASHIQETVY